MIFREQLKNAMTAHAAWKLRLREAVENGRSEFRPSLVRMDNECEFGRWMHSLPAAVKQSAIWKEVQLVHEQFHLEAGRILGLATGGTKNEALAALGTASYYGHLTVKLALLITRWGEKSG